MMSHLLIRPAARRSLTHIRHIRPVPPTAATGLAAAVYEEVERDFGMLAPPIALHAPQPPLLAAAWTLLRETLLATGELPRAHKEAIATAVSQANSCPYCIHVHTSALDALTPNTLNNEAHHLAAWATHPPDKRPTTPPTPQQLPEALGVATTFHYLNRMVNVFLGPAALPDRIPPTARRTVTRLFTRALRKTTHTHHEPGRSLDLLSPAPLPPDLHWATNTPTIAAAFARATATITTAAEHTIPTTIRTLLETHLTDWDGAPKPLDLTWLNTALEPLPPHDRPTARLVLLTAYASYRIDDTVITPLRDNGTTDNDLLTITAWSALTTARHTATHLVPPPTNP
ncbi:carboxymuconolactone decarboxylase family protein [Streptomyces sp. NPDC050842]|uniref:carboxymuconolactone decarboxylase family protein n=1 Tax=Streptomyces sp. NPDC050842 TaxID=3365636 RepID=UPI003795472A